MTNKKTEELVLIEQTEFVLDAVSWEKFNTILDNPPSIKPRLKALLDTPSPWDSTAKGNTYE